MNSIDIIRMAKESGMAGLATTIVCEFSELERFADLVAAAEREACVQIVFRHTGIPMDALRRGTGIRDRIVIEGERISAAIRARSQV